MNTRAITNVLCILCVAYGAFWALWFLPGCKLAKEIDQAIWNPPAAVDPGESPPPPAIAEYIAAGLALLGFGGMSAWIRRSNSRSKTSVADLASRITRLENLREHDK